MFIKSIIDLIEKSGTVMITAANSFGSGEEIFTLSASEWRRLCKAVGRTPAEDDEVTEELYDALKSADERTSCLMTAARMLSSSDKSARSIEQKLKAKKFSGEAIGNTIALLKKKGYLNEDEACRNYAVSAVRSKHYGRRRIIEYLISHGYPTEAAKNAADEIPDEDYRDALRYNIEKKCPDIGDIPGSECQKKIAALTRLGFSIGEILDEIKEIRKNNRNI